jgi:Mrp family chromosome partitioning ATPase
MVASTKGGTGRTTLALSLAGLLEETGHRVCLLDFDGIRGVSPYLVWAQTLRQPVSTHVLEKGPVEAARRLAGLRQGFDHVIIDASACETPS